MKLKILIIGLLLLFLNTGFAKNTITDYQRIFIPSYTSTGELKIALRVFKMNGIPSFLEVNPNTLETMVTPMTSFNPRKILKENKPGYFTKWEIQSTHYFQLLNKSTAPPYIPENQGIIHTYGLNKGNVLSIDLCPSSKPFEADFFKSLVKLADQNKKPTPITIAVSGLWLIKHQEEFKWLQTQKKENKLDITWANHSFSHIYYSDLPYSENFLAADATNVQTEILLTEQFLLEAGEIPSVFFRFPGLVSNEALIKQVRQYGLIPLGTDAWIADLPARHQSITPGGILLVHGNGNEPLGITLLNTFLSKLQLIDIKSVL